MIVAYEPFSVNYNHVPVNSEFLSIIAEKFQDRQVVFYGEERHISNVEKNITVKNVLFKSVKVVEPTESRIQSVLNEGKNIRQIVNERREDMDLMVVMNSHPHTMYFVKRYVPEKIPVIFIIHGNIEELKRKKKIYQLGYWVKPAFDYKKARKNTKYLVLGDSIRSHLLEYVDGIASQLSAVPHPYSLHKEKSGDRHITREKLVLGMIGTFSPEKRSDQLFDLQRRLQGNTNVSFLMVGSWENGNKPQQEGIAYIGDGIHKLSSEDFNRGIDELDYILFFWPRDSYQLTASGALCDAIVHEKPIISIRNDYLDWVFSKVGNLGFLCDDMDQMEKTIVSIADGELHDEVEKMKQNFEKAQYFFSRKHVAEILEKEKVWMI